VNFQPDFTGFSMNQELTNGKFADVRLRAPGLFWILKHSAHARRKFRKIACHPRQIEKLGNIECTRRVVGPQVFRGAAYAHKCRVPLAKLLKSLSACFAKHGRSFPTPLLAASERELVSHSSLLNFSRYRGTEEEL